MSKLVQIYKKLYRLIILPIILLIAFYYILVGPVANGDLLGTIFKPWGAAIILMLINHIYLEHLFTTPRDGLVNSINALILVLALYANNNLPNVNFSFILVYLITIFLSGLIFLLSYDKHKKITFLSKFSTKYGKSKIVFPLIALLTFTSINYIPANSLKNYEFSIDFEFSKLLFISIFYILFLILTSNKVIERAKSLPEKFLKLIKMERVGIITGNLTPNIITAEFDADSNIKINDLIVIGDLILNKKGDIAKENADKLGLILDFIGSQSETNNITARIYLLNEPQRNLNEIKRGLVKINEECKIVEKPDEILKNIESDRVKYYWKRRFDIIGIVTKASNINMLKVEIIRHQQLENAELVSVINKYTDRPIRYQIIDAETKRENQEEKKDFGYTQFLSYQLGEWRKPRDENGNEIIDAFRQFSEFQWVPNINSLVFKWNIKIDEQNISEEGVDTSGHYLLGKIPKTNLPIYLNIADLVSHHTAVLGVTGCGKTTLVVQLLREINRNQIFTLCLDITGEYKNQFTQHIDFFDKDTKDKWNAELAKIIDAKDKTQRRQISPEQADEVERKSSIEINKIVSDRIEVLRKESKIVILEIPEISNTKFALDYTQYLIQAVLQYAKNIYAKNINTKEEKDNFEC